MVLIRHLYAINGGAIQCAELRWSIDKASNIQLLRSIANTSAPFDEKRAYATHLVAEVSCRVKMQPTRSPFGALSFPLLAAKKPCFLRSIFPATWHCLTAPLLKYSLACLRSNDHPQGMLH